jgi:hypothetical protein
MPTNLGNAPLDGLKIGQTAVLRSYVGIDQIFPNATAITAAAFDNATVTNTAQNTNYTVQGEVGSSFTLTGATGATGPAGTQVLGSTSATYSIPIGGNDSCGNLARTPQITIAPQGNSVLASGLSNVDTISQAAGPAWVSNSGATLVFDYIINTQYNVVNQGGNLYWTQGAKWSIKMTYTQGSGGQNAVNWVFLTASGGNGWTFSNVTPSLAWTNNYNQLQFGPQNPVGGSGAPFTCELEYTAPSTNSAQVSFTGSLVDNPTGCWQSGASASSGALYP